MGNIASYVSTRLHFKAKVIEPLGMSEAFEVVTPVGTWRMSKADFYRVFPNVVASESYSGPKQEYHYPQAPGKAEEFRTG